MSDFKLIVHDLDDPPRRLMEEALEAVLRSRGESSLVTIERQSAPPEEREGQVTLPYDVALRLLRHEDTLEDRALLKEKLTRTVRFSDDEAAEIREEQTANSTTHNPEEG